TVTSSSDTADLLFYTPDGAVHRVTLPEGDDKRISDVLTAINAPGTAVTAGINEIKAGLNVVTPGILTISAPVADGETVSIGVSVYEFNSVGSVAAGRIAVAIADTSA